MDFLPIFALIVAFFAGIVFTKAFGFAVKRQALSLVNAKAGAKGRESKQLQESELVSLIGDATLAFKEGKEKGEDIKTTAMKVFPQLVAKYPVTVMKHGKKLLKSVTDGGGMEALEGFL